MPILAVIPDPSTLSDAVLAPAASQFAREFQARAAPLTAQRLSTSNSPQLTVLLAILYHLTVSAQYIMDNNYSPSVLLRYLGMPFPLSRRLGCTYGVAANFTAIYRMVDRDNFVPTVPVKPTPVLTNVYTWDVAFVCDWLTQQNLAHLRQWFADQDINGIALVTINFDDLMIHDQTFEVVIGQSAPALTSAIAALVAVSGFVLCECC